jgi:hypothetical protein
MPVLPVVFLAFLIGAPGPPALKVQEVMGRLQASERQAKAGKPAAKVAFELSDAEINQYLQFALRTRPRPGLNSITVKIFPHNYISTFTTIDFDAVEKWKPGTVPMLLRPVLNGRKAIWVDYRFRTAGGQVTFTVEKAYFGSIRLPAFFVGKMMQVVAARQPEHYDTSKPLPLPYGLRQVATRAHAILGEN